MRIYVKNEWLRGFEVEPHVEVVIVAVCMYVVMCVYIYVCICVHTDVINCIVT